MSDTSEDINDVYWKIQFFDDKQKSLLISTKFGGVEDPEAFKYIFGEHSIPSQTHPKS